MKIYQNIQEFKKIENAIVTIGTFDGVHLGHQKIIQRLCELAKEKNGESVLLTFFPHPRMIIDPENQNLKLINTITEKSDILRKLGLDHLIISPFTRDFSNLSAEAYIKNILIDSIGTKMLIVGYDHRFGKDRQGGLSELKQYSHKYDFEVEEIPEQDIHDVAVSSTKIREALLAGQIELAADYLGYAFELCGPVIKGDKIGRTIGFPTANIFIEETYKLIPGDGIYAVTIQMEDAKKYKGMAYIGQRPTINGMTRNVEVNIFDFKEEIYGQKIKMQFLKFLRPDVKFSGLEELTQQLHKDKQDTLNFFAKQK